MRCECCGVTLFEVVIVPGILVAAFLAALLVIAAVCARKYLGYVAARRMAADVATGRYRAVQEHERQQADVIASVITEMAGHPATYETFPQDLRESLYAAHDAGRAIERNAR
jgi:hypothetical protein